MADHPPHVWIVSRGRKGDLDQMLALARAVGWPYEVKQLRFAGPDIPVLARFLLKDRAALSAPWPDLVLCAEASPSMIAKHIRQMSMGKTRAVCIGRPAGATRDFDLVLTTAQYRIPAAAHVVELSMPLAAESEPLSAQPQPDGPIALIVGGPAFPDRLDAAVAAQLAADALAYAARRNKPLAVHTSPRTPPQVSAALAHAITAPHRLHVFGQGPNRYRELLAEASEIIVTSDSVSMTSDALAAGRPVSIYRLPQHESLKLRLGDWLYHHAVEAPKPGLAPVRWLFNAGIIEAAADRRRLFARLVAEKRAVWFDDTPLPPQPEAASKDLALAVHSLRAVMA